jgi:GNAT superfamily N-acetyltransferase
MYQQQMGHFADGQFTALVMTDQGEVVVGATTTMRTNQTFESDDHPYYFEFIGQGTLSTHDPNGEWLYGIDVGVHPDFRGIGIGRRLYDARRELVRRLNLRGEIVAGLMPGYPRYRDHMTVEAYARRTAAGEINDPTLSMQLRQGFQLRKLLYRYVTDPRSDNVVTLLIRENPYYRR